ncbi:MAG: hypothetical protein GXP54_13780 [Deltaproteobacteria bacterium]|nr:hypothetical protein [Deltaproteobacteria bacterium]
MSEALHFAEHTLQEATLVIMAIVYTSRLVWLFRRFKAGKERQGPTGAPNTTPRKGFLYSWAIIGMPWVMESSRTKPIMYGTFVIFHLGVVLAIAESFIIPYGASMLAANPWLATLIQVSTGAACAVGVFRIIRRVSDSNMRAISSPDDYFSLVLLTVWFAFASLSAPNQGVPEWVLLTYFWMTAFFLLYVPFSKISHYLYYPITRYYLGKSLGNRGVYPIVPSAPGYGESTAK